MTELERVAREIDAVTPQSLNSWQLEGTTAVPLRLIASLRQVLRGGL